MGRTPQYKALQKHLAGVDLLLVQVTFTPSVILEDFLTRKGLRIRINTECLFDLLGSGMSQKQLQSYLGKLLLDHVEEALKEKEKTNG